jgi:hypothetical protein
MDHNGNHKNNHNAPAAVRVISPDWDKPETTTGTNATNPMELPRPVLIYDNK